MKTQFEKPFEYLRRKTGGLPFDEAIVKNWYKARSFTLDALGGFSIKPDTDRHLHVLVKGDSPLMLSVVRQVALSAHYINFNENEKKHNRTVITLASRNPNIVDELKKEEYLCNLMDLCKWSINGSTPKNTDSYLDVELEIVEESDVIPNDPYERVITEEEVNAFCNAKSEQEIMAIDTRKAVLANRMYGLGKEIDNLPYEDIHSTQRYSLALDVFQYVRMKEKMQPLINASSWEDQIAVLEGLSSIHCADCFMSRYNSIKECCDGKTPDMKAWEKHNDVLSKSEHSRWVVEKLIMGYSTISNEQRLTDEGLAYDKAKRSQYRKSLKRDWKAPSHIDLCSFSDLRRIDPDNMKYDSFLMLGIPEILKEVGEI